MLEIPYGPCKAVISYLAWKGAVVTQSIKLANAVMTSVLDELTSEEQEVWLIQFADKMREPSKSETVFFDKRRSLRLGVGLSDSGELIYEIEPALK